MKPFYLNGKAGLAVTLDGPALRVRMPERSATLYPLARISRVIATPPVDWSTEALLACAERGITVTFLNRQGDPLAYVFGETSRRSDLYHRLRDLLDRPDWRDRYGDWYRAMESRARRALAVRLNLPVDPLPAAAQLTTTLNAFKQRYASPGVYRFIERRCQGFLAALAAELLAESGLSAERMRGLADRLHLTEDLARLLAWDLHLPVLDLLYRHNTGQPVARIEDTELVRLFEARTPRLRKLGRTVLNRLHGWLAELHR